LNEETLTIVLFQPQIPQNVGNVVRTCGVTGNSLILVRPLGFSTTSRHLKRAGLDYWEGVDVSIIEEEELEELLQTKKAPCFFFSSHGKKRITDLSYPPNSILVFGSETEGLPKYFFEKWPEAFGKIPMVEGSRCLNLATSVGIVTYEAMRQNEFKSL